MLFVKSISALLQKAAALCDKAISQAEAQTTKAQEKTKTLEAAIRSEGAKIDQANRERKVAEAFKAKLNEFEKGAVDAH